MKWFTRIINNIIVKISRKADSSRKTFHELDKIAYKKSAEFINENLGRALLFSKMEPFWTHAVNSAPKSGLMMEFGVFSGNSINFFSKQMDSNKDQRSIYGFDSFEGLSEDWGGTDMKKGHFDTGGKLPKVNANVKLVKGWIENTLPGFINENILTEKYVSFIHIDVDTYGPTKCIFENTIKHFQVGTVIVFDELLGYPGYQEHELKALKEVLDPKCKYEFISFCEYKRKDYTSEYIRSAIQITEINL